MVGGAARELGCSGDLVRYYERIGRLPAVRTTGGIRLFERGDVMRLAAARKCKKK